MFSGDPQDTEHVEDLRYHVGAALWGFRNVSPIANINAGRSGVQLRTQPSFPGYHENSDRTTGGLSVPRIP